MTDKYQEALDQMCNRCFDGKPRRVLQELVDKNTPKKVKISIAIEYDQIEEGWYEKHYYYCPNCNSLVDKPNYCPNCGQALDWSDENE